MRRAINIIIMGDNLELHGDAQDIDGIDAIEFDNVSISGRKLFGSLEEMRAHVPDHVMPRFVEVINTISSLEMFKMTTRLDYLLKLDFTTDMTPGTRSNISRFLSSINAPDKCVDKQGSDVDFFSWDDLKNTTLHENLYLAIMSDLEEDIARLDTPEVKPLSHGTSHQEYKMCIKHLCKNIFIKHYMDLQSIFDNELQPISKSNLASYSSSLCDYIEMNTDRSSDFFNRNCAITDADTYYKNVYNSVTEKESREGAVDQAFKKIFLACYYPYFVFEFLMNNVATMEQDSLESAPRFFFVHRISVLGAYMFLFYVMATIIDKLGSTKLQSHYGKAFAIMSKINDNLFAQENSTHDQEFGYTDLQNQTHETRKLAMEVQSMSQDVMKIKNNLNKAAVNSVLLSPQVASSRTQKTVWLAFLIVSVVLLFAMLFLSNFKYVTDTFYAFSTLVVIIVLIAYLVRVFT